MNLSKVIPKKVAVKPTIKVKNMPGKIDNGIDQQLLRSIRELLKDVN